MRNRLVAIGLAGLLSLAVTACGGNTPETTTTTSAGGIGETTQPMSETTMPMETTMPTETTLPASTTTP
ncbi:MAG: hypothetical protein WB239_04860 [Acidimicrobiia bacterium]